jgi:hypothetical protein
VSRPAHVPQHTSDTAEWFTPPEIIEAARATLEGIDLDPASCSRANEAVKAVRFFGAGSSVENGFTTGWAGRVFLNPPGGRCDEHGVRLAKGGKSAAKRWWEKLANEWASGNVAAAVFLGFSVEILQSTQVKPKAPIPCSFPLCFPSRRVAFIDPSGARVTGNTHASVIVYLPPHGKAYREGVERFVRAFEEIGALCNIPDEIAENRG